MYYLLSPLALAAGDYIKLAIEATLAFSPILAGLLAGLVIWPAILGGVYHAVILPLVLLEMEKSGVSFLGAVDMVGLVMVAAGINLANVIAPREKVRPRSLLQGCLLTLVLGLLSNPLIRLCSPIKLSLLARYSPPVWVACCWGY